MSYVVFQKPQLSPQAQAEREQALREAKETAKEEAPIWAEYFQEAADRVRTISKQEYFCFTKKTLQSFIESVIQDVLTPSED